MTGAQISRCDFSETKFVQVDLPMANLADAST